MQEQGKEEAGKGDEGEDEGVGIEGAPAGSNGGGNSGKGEKIDEAKAGEGTGNEVADGLPDCRQGSHRPDAEGKETEKGRDDEGPVSQEQGVLTDPPPGVGEGTEEDGDPQNNPWERKVCSAAFVAGGQG